MITGVDVNTKFFAVARVAKDAPYSRNAILFAVVGKETKGRTAEERLPGLFQAFYDYLLSHGADDFGSVWVEDVAFVGGSRSTAQMAQCVAAVRIACHLCGIPCYPISNSLWKREIIGRGNASKEEIKEFLVRQYWFPDNLEPPDLYDAFGVAVAGLRRLPTGPQNAPGAS